MDNRKNNGGVRKGAGRPKKADMQTLLTIYY
jgi:hypothetical protein